MLPSNPAAPTLIYQAPTPPQVSAAACLMSLASEEGRHAAVAARAGAIPAALRALRRTLPVCATGASSGSEAEADEASARGRTAGEEAERGRAVPAAALPDFIAALFASLCRYKDVQVWGPHL